MDIQLIFQKAKLHIVIKVVNNEIYFVLTLIQELCKSTRICVTQVKVLVLQIFPQWLWRRAFQAVLALNLLML